jgi:hypothetical protein
MQDAGQHLTHKVVWGFVHLTLAGFLKCIDFWTTAGILVLYSKRFGGKGSKDITDEHDLMVEVENTSIPGSERAPFLGGLSGVLRLERGQAARQ